MTVKPPSRLLPYIVPKGFIAIDGTSLTVCDVDHVAGTFNFMLIAFTQQKVIIPLKAVGDEVNLEVDVISKYVERFDGGMLNVEIRTFLIRSPFDDGAISRTVVEFGP